MSSTLQFAIRSKDGIALKEHAADGSLVTVHSWADPATRLMRFDANGRHLFIATSDALSMYALPSLAEKTARQLIRLELPFLQDFACHGRLLCTMQKPLATAGTISGIEKNIKVWALPEGKMLHESPGKAVVHFLDGAAFAKCSPGGEVQVWRPSYASFDRLSLGERIDAVACSGRMMALFAKEQAGRPASVRIVDTASKTVVVQKSFFKADRIDMYWSPSGKHLLALTHADIDRTGKSYYGEDHLYLLGIDGCECRVALDREGPVHDCTWHPRGVEFIVIFGFMPAKTMLFDCRGEPVFTFDGIGPKNLVRYNHDGAAIAFGAFGNLAGSVDIWSRHRMHRVGGMQAPNSTIMQWSMSPADAANSSGGAGTCNSVNGHSQTLITATLTPRLRVDNGYCIWNWRGEQIRKESFAELYQVAWRPGYDVLPALDGSIDSIFSGKHVDSPSLSASTSTTTAYRPPRLRGTPSTMARDADGNFVSSTAGISADGNSPKSNPKPAPPSAPSTISKEERQLRRLREKLSQVEDLKVKIRSGDRTLERNQLDKIAGEGKLRDEIVALERLCLK